MQAMAKQGEWYGDGAWGIGWGNREEGTGREGKDMENTSSTQKQYLSGTIFNVFIGNSF